MKYLDLPPVYLIAALFVAYWVGQAVPVDLGMPGRLIGMVLLAAGLILIGLALWALIRAKTTPIPREDPNALVATGIFRLSRNPIYLGDALILTGLCIRWDAALALPLVPLFIWFITRRFIEQEEQTLRTAFPDTYPAYLSATRRWL